MQSRNLSEWTEYYEKFPYFSHNCIRDKCHPLKAEHDEAKKAIVLIHGLSDSPYFMCAIAKIFFSNGYNVYLPLLQSHGLKEPGGMEDASLDEWLDNVNYAIDTAAKKATYVSIGGLSTGGALSFYISEGNKKVNGALYLFSAALHLYGKTELLGEIKQDFIGTKAGDIIEAFEKFFRLETPLIGGNPYRYSHVDLDGARQLGRLIDKTDQCLNKYGAANKRDRWTFAVHSASDETASIAGIEDLQKNSKESKFIFYSIPNTQKISHASVVLEEDIMFKSKEFDRGYVAYGPDEFGNDTKEPKNKVFSILKENLEKFIAKVPV